MSWFTWMDTNTKTYINCSLMTKNLYGNLWFIWGRWLVFHRLNIEYFRCNQQVSLVCLGFTWKCTVFCSVFNWLHIFPVILSPWCQLFLWAFVQCRKPSCFWDPAQRDRKTLFHETSWNLGLCFCSLWQPVGKEGKKTNMLNVRICAGFFCVFVQCDLYCTHA